MRKLLGIAELGFTAMSLLLFSGGLIHTFFPSAGSPIKQAIWFGIYGVTFFLLIARSRSTIRTILRDKLLVILVGLVLVSSCWSTVPAVTLRRSVALLGTTLFGVYLAARYPLKEQIKLLGLSLSIAAMLSAVFALALPSYGIGSGVTAGTWQGIYTHKNPLGSMMALSTLVLFISAVSERKYRWAKWVGIILSFSLVLLSTSKGALMTVVVFFLLLPIYRTLRLPDSLMIPVLIVTAVLSAGVTTLLLENSATLLGSLGKDTTLTGRTDLWPLVWEFIWKRPWIGYGYNAFWEDESEYGVIWLQLQWDAPNSHNGFLDLWLSLGLLGLSIYVFGFLWLFLRAVTWSRLTRTIESLFPLLFLTWTLQANLIESQIMEQNSIHWIIYVALALSTGKRPAQASKLSEQRNYALRVIEQNWSS